MKLKAQRAARLDMGRKRAEKALNKAIESASGNGAKALELFSADPAVQFDPLVLEYFADYFFGDVWRERLDEALVTELVRRINDKGPKG